MSEEELRQEILNHILNLYCARYEGFLSVEKIDTMYKFSIGIPSYMCPTTISIETDSDEKFLSFIYEELRKRNYIRLYIYKVERTNESREE